MRCHEFPPARCADAGSERYSAKTGVFGAMAQGTRVFASTLRHRRRSACWGLQSWEMADDDTVNPFAAVPLFPLPNVVLFPRAVLPLHIFEERYKAMTAAA